MYFRRYLRLLLCIMACCETCLLMLHACLKSDYVRVSLLSRFASRKWVPTRSCFDDVFHDISTLDVPYVHFLSAPPRCRKMS